jgi:O-antigen ligase/polysaccharide polymerase Wzy-like membrane protein
VASHTQPVETRPLAPLVVAALGAALFAVSLAQNPATAVAGAVAFAGATVLALRETHKPILTWPNAIVCLVLVVWLIPIRLYRLPVGLPFNLEPYRIMVLLLIFGLLVAVMAGHLPLTAAGHGWPLLALAGVAFISQAVNWNVLDIPGQPPVAFKTLSYFVSFVAIFLLIAATIQRFADARQVVMGLVAGGAVVAVAALIESRTRSNLFENLDNWIPGLVKQPREVLELRGGRLRVRGSAQHPIALGVALTMIVPLAIVLAHYASTTGRRLLWFGAAGVCTMGALVTVSRTVVAMAVVMSIVGFLLRPEQMLKFWPALLILPAIAHAAAPGTLGALYKAIFPKEGLAADLNSRAGLGGSGRLADVTPGLDLWHEAPLVGHGLGFVATTVTPVAQGATQGATGFQIIFDNQYMATLVSLGALGLVAAVWVVWGAAFKLIRAARKHREGPEADLVAACALSCAGFGASMLFFDAFAFVQATIVFFIIAAVGLRLRQLGLEPAPVIPIGDRRGGIERQEVLG